jgi:hypothetical protein
MTHVVMTRLAGSVLLLLLSLPAVAQITIQNPKKLKVPDARVAVIYDVVRELVFEEVKPAGGKPVNMKLTLSLAVRPEFGYLTNEEKGTAEVFMTEWDEPRFAYVVMALALQQALPANRRSELLREARRRVDLLSPVDVSQLKKEKIPARILSTPALAPDPLVLRCSADDVPQPAECRRTLLPMQFNATPNKHDRP